MQPCCDVDYALAQCPFLRGVKDRQGEAAARRIANKPLDQQSGFAPILQEDYGFNSVLEMVHGPQGVCPVRIAGTAWTHEAPLQPARAPTPCAAVAPTLKAVVPPTALSAAPFASISFPLGLGGGGWPWDANKKKQRDAKRRQNRKKPESKARAQQQAQQQASSSAAQQPSAFQRGLQPLTALVMSKAGHLQCPPPVLALRAFVAKTPVVRALRPQELPFRIAASGVLAGLANVPCGAVRSHFEKFSPGWIVAVHLSLPFVGALRKAMVLPPAALAVTIAGAVAGQMVGARLEKARLLHVAEQEAALARGDRGPYDMPLLCATLKALRNPWEDPWAVDAGAVALETSALCRAEQSRLDPPRGALALPWRSRPGGGPVAAC